MITNCNKYIFCGWVVITIIIVTIILCALNENNYITLNTEIYVLDVASLIVASIFAFVIPYILKKIIDDNKMVKAEIASETRNLLDLSFEVNSVVGNCYSRQSLLPSDKKKILDTFYDIELKNDSLAEQLSVSYPSNKKISAEIFESYAEFNDQVTGGELMNDTFTTVSPDFKTKVSRAHEKHRREILVCIHKIYKL